MVQLVPMGIGRTRWDNKILAVLLILLGVLLVAQVLYSNLSEPKAVMHIAGSRFEVRVADDQKSRTQGLSGTSHMPADEAMLFIFDSNDKWSIWMKDMNYPIDIVWLNEEKRVVDFATNVQPSSYPNKTFTPKEEARYVLEFKSGIVEEKGIKAGQEAVFSGMSRNL